MMKKTLIATALAASVMPLLAQADNYIQPGEWQQTIHITTASGKTLPAKTSKSCVKPEEASNMRDALSRNQGKSCKVSHYNRDGNVVTWAVVCAGPSHSKTAGKMVRTSATRYTMDMDSSISYGGRTTKTHITGEAKRLGGCQ